ncbi:MAG: hypothetical protein FIA92_16480 [Chloroflexi bacterium]|nr:hypothetical protein [Chloroflexota bacterium]
MYEYGNARIAARRARLLGPETLARLAGAESADAMLVMLERLDDWRVILRELGTLVTPPRSGIELAVERHRSGSLASLPRLYPPPARALVEALVMPLDLQRILEVLRRRRGGEPPESIESTVGRGALLGDPEMGRLARAATSDIPRLLGAVGVLATTAAMQLAAAWNATTDSARQEADLQAAIDGARLERAEWCRDGIVVARIIEAERAERASLAAELDVTGASAAAAAERMAVLARLDELAARAHRDPLGVGVVAGYVAAIEAQAIRLRAALAAASGGWSRERTNTWLMARAA